jgi:hypothetical protein
MAASHPLPTFFGRFTAVLSEHEHLSVTLRKLGELCAALESGRPVAAELEPAALIADLRTELGNHFAAEEASGHFGTVARDCPILLPKIVELKADHSAMLETSRRLALIAADEARHPELAVPVQQLITRLQHHEREENALLREYFERDAAQKD